MAGESSGMKISAFPAAENLSGTDLLAGVQQGANRRFSLSVLLAWVRSALNLSGSDVGLGNVANVLQYSASNPPKKTGTVALSASWNGSGSYYSQTVTVSGATVAARSKIDLQPTPVQIAGLASAEVKGLLIENNDGTLTAWAVGAAPTAAMTVQCTVEETA